MDIETIIAEITSRDTHKVWRSSCEIISLGQEPSKIKPMIEFLPLIKEKSSGLDMGGAFAPNQRFIDFAIRTIEFHRDNDDCPCKLYAEHGLNPKKEVDKGYIVINDITKIDGNWIDYYIAECTRCGQKFKILESEGHYMWWEWSLL